MSGRMSQRSRWSLLTVVSYPRPGTAIARASSRGSISSSDELGTDDHSRMTGMGFWNHEALVW